MAAQEIGSLFVNLAMNSASFDSQLKKIAADVKGFGTGISGSLNSIVGGMRVLGAGLAALGIQQAAQAVGTWAKSMADAGEQASLLASQLGLTLDQTVRMQGVFQLTEGSLGEAAATFAKLGKAMLSARTESGTARDAFATIGITLADLNRVGGDHEKMLELLADRWTHYNDSALKSAAYSELLGKGFAKLIPAMRDGADGIRKLREQAEGLDPRATEAAAAGDKLATQFDVLSKATTGLGNQIFLTLMPQFEGVVTKATELVTAFREGVGAIDSWLGPINGISGAIDLLREAILRALPMIGALMAAWDAVKGISNWRAGLDRSTTEEMMKERENQEKGIGTLKPLIEGGFVEERFGKKPQMKEDLTKKKSGGGGGGGDSRIAEWRDELEQMQIAERKFFADSTADELKFWQDKLALVANGSKEWLQIRKTIFDLEKRLAVQRRDDGIRDAEADSRVTDEQFSRREQAIKHLVEIDQMSRTEGIEAERALTEEKWRLDQEYYEKKRAAAEGDTRTLKTLDDQQRVDRERHLTTLAQLEQRNEATRWERLKSFAQDFASVLENTFSSVFDKIGEGTFKIKDALGSLMKDLGKMIASRAFKELIEGGSGGGGLLGMVGKLFGFGGGDSGALGPGEGDFGGMAQGGSFRVGGSGPVDSKIVAFRASPGELVDVTPANQRPGGGGGEVIRIDLNPSEGWVSGVADQRIVTHSGQIVDIAVRQSQRTVARNFGGMSAEAQTRTM